MGEPATALRLPGGAGAAPASPTEVPLERAMVALEKALRVAEQELEALIAEQKAARAAGERWLGLAELRQCVGTIRQASDGLAALRPRKPRG